MAEEAKVVLVTGSSSGIGASIAQLYAEKGFKVVVHGSKKEKVDKVVAECDKLSPSNLKALGVVLDFSVPENGPKLVKQTVDHFGRLDVLVNNAGIFVKVDLDNPKFYEYFTQVMNINLNSTVSTTIAAVEELKKTRGNIVFISSVASQRASRSGHVYCMSKAAMSMFAKCLAIELAQTVRVNTVSPGPVRTEIFARVGVDIDAAAGIMGETTLVNRIGKPEEVAKSVYFLTSQDGEFINGHELMIDGGYLLKNAAIQQQIRDMKEKQ